MTTQTKKVLSAMPGSLPELMERTGYPAKYVLAYIVALRAEGKRIIVKQVDGVSTFEQEVPDAGASQGR